MLEELLSEVSTNCKICVSDSSWPCRSICWLCWLWWFWRDRQWCREDRQRRARGHLRGDHQHLRSPNVQYAVSSNHGVALTLRFRQKLHDIKVKNFLRIHQIIESSINQFSLICWLHQSVLCKYLFDGNFVVQKSRRSLSGRVTCCRFVEYFTFLLS